MFFLLYQVLFGFPNWLKQHISMLQRVRFEVIFALGVDRGEENRSYIGTICWWGSCY